MKTIKQKPSVKKYLAGNIFFVLLTVSLLFYRDTLLEIFKGIHGVTWTQFMVSIFFAFLGYFFEGLTVFTMMKTVSLHAKVQDGVFISFVCEFYRLTTFGSGSGVAEIHYLHEKKIEPGSAAVLTMLQYVIKRAAIMLSGTVGFIYLCRKKSTRSVCIKYKLFVGIACLLTLVIIIIFLCIVLSQRITYILLQGLDWLSIKIQSKKAIFENWKEQILLLNESGISIIGEKKKMLSVILLQIGKLTTFYLIPVWFIKDNINLTFGECIFIMALAYMLSGVIPAPSGAGALEFVFLLFFCNFIDLADALPAILLFRFCTWICPAVVGGMFLLIRRLSKRINI